MRYDVFILQLPSRLRLGLFACWALSNQSFALPSESENHEPVLHDTRSPEDPVFPVPDYRDGKFSDADRNIMITKNYRLLSEKLRLTIDCPLRTLQPALPYTTNWLHLATWASRSAGDFISDEQHKFLEWIVRNWLGSQRDSMKNQILAFLAGRMPEGVVLGGQKNEVIVNTIKRLLAIGNWVVADEVQGVSAAFIERFASQCQRIVSGDFDAQQHVQSFLSQSFRQNISNRSFDSVLSEAMAQIKVNLANFDKGERYDREKDMLLALGFRIYFEVMSQPQMSSKRRKQLMFLANVLVGIHEQHVLQTYIRGALSSFDAIHPDIKKIFGATVMRLGVPVGEVGCQRSVVKNLNQIKFNRKVSLQPPESLAHLDEPELAHAVSSLDLLNGLGDGVSDWTDYQGRIRFIAAVYRGLHEYPELTGSPYLSWCPKDSILKVHASQ